MEINRESLKKAETWMVLAPALLLLLGIVVMFNMHSARAMAETKLKVARKVVANANEIIKISQEARLSLSGSAGKEQFETVESMKKCAEIARIPENNIPRISGDKGKLLRDGREILRERVELNNVRIEQIGVFIDYAESNYESLRCNNIAITPSANKSNKDRWNTTLQFEHIK